MFLDCQTTTHQLIDGCLELPHFQIMVVYSGLSETLVGTEYNSRVAECHAATQTLLEKADLPGADDLKLRSVLCAIFE
jgi:galactokinase/galacturonokinase